MKVKVTPGGDTFGVIFDGERFEVGSSEHLGHLVFRQTGIILSRETLLRASMEARAASEPFDLPVPAQALQPVRVMVALPQRKLPESLIRRVMGRLLEKHPDLVVVHNGRKGTGRLRDWCREHGVKEHVLWCPRRCGLGVVYSTNHVMAKSCITGAVIFDNLDGPGEQVVKHAKRTCEELQIPVWLIQVK